MADGGRSCNDLDEDPVREVWSNDISPGEHDSLVGGLQFRHRRGRGLFWRCMYSNSLCQRKRTGPAGGSFPGPKKRFEEEDGEVVVSDGQDGGYRRRFIPYGRPNRRGGGCLHRGRGVGFRVYRTLLGSDATGNSENLRGGPSSGKSNSWYKITIPYGRKYDKKWLLTSLQNLCPIPFTAVHYSTEGRKVQFYLKNATAANALCKITHRITDNEGYKVVVIMNPCSPPSFIQSDLKEQDLECLKLCMSKRFDCTEQFLDLNSIHCDPDLVSQNIKVVLSRKSCMQAVIRIIKENVPDLKSLNVSNNRLYRLGDLAELVNVAPNLKTLNLSHNEMKSEQELDKVKCFKLTELWLDHNPLCDHFKDQDTYISAVRERFPRLLKLDGHSLPASIGFDVESHTPVPPCKGSYFGSNEIKEFIMRFLQQYFSVYDSGDRRALLEAYHDGACFSLSLPFPMHIPYRSTLGDYNNHSRNFKKVRDAVTRFRLLKLTRLNVVAILSELPKTQHDMASLVIDVNTYTQTLLAFTVSGVFKEVDDKSRDTIRAFSRVFIAVPAVNSGLCLVNDELFVRTANAEELRHAFATPAPTPSSSPVSMLSSSQQEMLSAFSQKSQVNLEWCQKCLQHCEWDFNRAVQVFTELKAQGSIPEVAFIS